MIIAHTVCMSNVSPGLAASGLRALRYTLQVAEMWAATVVANDLGTRKRWRRCARICSATAWTRIASSRPPAIKGGAKVPLARK